MEPLLTDKDVMDWLGIVDKRTLRRYRRQGGLDFIRMGRTYKYTKDMVEVFLHRNSSLSIKSNNNRKQ